MRRGEPLPRGGLARVPPHFVVEMAGETLYVRFHGARGPKG